MKLSGGTALALLFVALAGGIYYYEYFSKSGPHAPLQEAAPLPIAASTAAAPKYPVPAASEEAVDEAQPAVRTKKGGKAKTLPPEKKGPLTLEESLAALFGEKAMRFFDLDSFAGHFVVAVDNEPTPQIPPQFLPLKPAAGSLAVQGEGGESTLDPKNYDRYRPYVQLLDKTSAKKMTDLYVHFYPVFQKAYAEAGNQGYFNDKVVAAVEDLLNAPNPQGPIQLTQPNVFYHFADPQLENLSAGQKILVRMGPDNSAKVKAKLKELHELLTHLGNKAKAG